MVKFIKTLGLLLAAAFCNSYG
eukprot:COSAG03_NODE_7636_length_890_cov_1.074589_1_plen_21_part_10